MNATLSPSRVQYRELLGQLAAKTQTKLPQLNGRVEKACKLVLGGDVELQGAKALVHSLTDPAKTYTLEPGHCTCADFPRAPEYLCAHRLAAGFLRKIQETLGAAHEPLEAPACAPVTSALPEAPASANVRVHIDGREVQVTLRGTSEDDVLARVEKVLARYPAPPQAPKAPRQEGDTPRCPRHGKLRQGKRGWFCPRKLDDGTYCEFRIKD
jgi:hypothetical protein